MGTCRCGAQCQGALCRQCEIERQFEHKQERLARDQQEDEDDE